MTSLFQYFKKYNPLSKKAEQAITEISSIDSINAILERIPPTPANYLSIVGKNIMGDFSDINPVDLEAGANRCAVS